MSALARDHLVIYVSSRDIAVVLARVPAHSKARLRDVFVSRNSRGARMLGWVARRGRRDITLCSVLPPRVGLGRFVGRGQTAAEFGAPARGQWPPWAVRRFLLYDVLLHELGHLQLVRPDGRRTDRKYAAEPLAKHFARDTRRDMFATNFEHPDPVHNPPSSSEEGLLPVWVGLDKAKRERLVRLVLTPPECGEFDTSWLGTLNPEQRVFLQRTLCRER